MIWSSEKESEITDSLWSRGEKWLETSTLKSPTRMRFNKYEGFKAVSVS